MAEPVETSPAAAAGELAQTSDGDGPRLAAAADPPAASTPPRQARRPWVRAVVLVLVLALISSAVYFLFFTAQGDQVRHHPRAAGIAFRHWVDGHRVVAPLILLALYVAIGMSLMPVWWLQLLAGYGFGVWLGTAYSLLGAALGAVCSYGASRLLLADYVRRRFESRYAKLREVDEKMGHNGLLVVMAARLTHVLPFGISNYLFGVTRITPMDVVLGTILGNAPMITFYVATGAGMRPWHNFWFMTVLATVNFMLLVPIILRYWRPEWFKKIGVE